MFEENNQEVPPVYEQQDWTGDNPNESKPKSQGKFQEYTTPTLFGLRIKSTAYKATKDADFVSFGGACECVGIDSTADITPEMWRDAMGGAFFKHCDYNLKQAIITLKKLEILSLNIRVMPHDEVNARNHEELINAEILGLEPVESVEDYRDYALRYTQLGIKDKKTNAEKHLMTMLRTLLEHWELRGGQKVWPKPESQPEQPQSDPLLLECDDVIEVKALTVDKPEEEPESDSESTETE